MSNRPICLRLNIFTLFQQVSSFGAGQSTRPIGGRISSRSVDDSHVTSIGGVDPGKDKILGLSSGRADHSLPPDATNTLFVEGLPPNCTRREVARILSSGFPFNAFHFFFWSKGRLMRCLT